MSLGDRHASVESLQTEVLSLRKELIKKQDMMEKLQDRERQLRERLGLPCDTTNKKSILSLLSGLRCLRLVLVQSLPKK